MRSSPPTHTCQPDHREPDPQEEHLRQRRQRAAGLLLWLIFSVLIGAAYVRIPPSPDQSIFDYIGLVITKGGTAYVDAADQNFPGKMGIHAISTFLFGNNLWSFRLFDYIWLLLTCCLLYRVLRAWFAPLTGIVGALVYQMIYVTSGSWMAGQRDIVAAPLMLCAGLCALHAIRSRQRAYWLAEAAFLTGAILIRPTFALAGPAFVVMDFLMMKETGRPIHRILLEHAFVGMMLIVFTTVSLLAFLGQAGLVQWYDLAILFNLHVDSWETGRRTVWDTTAGIGRAFLQWWHWYAVLGIAGVVQYLRSARRNEARLLIIIAAVTLASVLMQGQETTYHLGPLLLIMALLMSPVIASSIKAVHRSTMTRKLDPLATLVCVIVFLGLAKKAYGTLGGPAGSYLGAISHAELLERYSASGDEHYLTVRDAVVLAQAIRNDVEEGETVLLWGSCTLVNYLSDRLAPIRLISFSLVNSTRPSFSLYASWEHEVRSSMTTRPPEMILLIRKGETPGQYLFLEDGHIHGGFGHIIKKTVEDSYQLERAIGRVDLYRRVRR